MLSCHTLSGIVQLLPDLLLAVSMFNCMTTYVFISQKQNIRNKKKS